MVRTTQKGGIRTNCELNRISYGFFYESTNYIIRKLRIEFESGQSSIPFSSFGALEDDGDGASDGEYGYCHCAKIEGTF
jgi:hypothetical protein